MEKPGRRKEDGRRGAGYLFCSMVILAAGGLIPRGRAHTGSAAGSAMDRARTPGSSPPGRPEPGFTKTPVLHLGSPSG